MSDSETGTHPLHRAIRGSEGGEQEEEDRCKPSLQVTRSSGWGRSVKQSWGISGFELESQGDSEAGERNQDFEGRHFQGQDTLVYLGHAEWGPGGHLDGVCHWAADASWDPRTEAAVRKWICTWPMWRQWFEGVGMDHKRYPRTGYERSSSRRDPRLGLSTDPKCVLKVGLSY